MRFVGILGIILLSTIMFSNVFAQTGSRDIMDEYCKANWQRDPYQCGDYIPEGYGKTVNEISQNKFTQDDEVRRQQMSQNPDLKCPSGTYYGLDNQGNPACRDTQTNQIVDPNTGIRFDSQTGNVALPDEQISGIVIGVIILIIIIAIIAKIASSKSESDRYVEYEKSSPLPRRGWDELEKEEVRIRQRGLCNKCGRPPPRWEYHHIDGNRSNNSIRNCEGLCPNCHSVKTHDE